MPRIVVLDCDLSSCILLFCINFTRFSVECTVCLHKLRYPSFMWTMNISIGVGTLVCCIGYVRLSRPYDNGTGYMLYSQLTKQLSSVHTWFLPSSITKPSQQLSRG